MHRFFVDAALTAGKPVALSPQESAHALRVLRLREGAQIQVLNGRELWQATLAVSGPEAAAVPVAPCPSPESATQVTLWQGTPKGDKLETVVQKGTELGMWALWPVDMARSVARGERRQDRLCRAALEAAKQSGRAHVPEVAPLRGFAQALADASGFDLIVTLWEEERAQSLSQAVGAYLAAHGRPKRVLLVIGPEGGIAPEEWEALRGAGAVSASLGMRILRTETAGLCALSVLWAALGEM